MGCGASTFDGVRYGTYAPGDESLEHSPWKTVSEGFEHSPWKTVSETSKGSEVSWCLTLKEANRLPAPTSFLLRLEQRILVDRIMDEVEDWRLKSQMPSSHRQECRSPERFPSQDWGADNFPLVSNKEDEVHAPVVIIEPWGHVGYNQFQESVRASTNAAVISRRIGLDAQCIPLWQLGSTFSADDFADKIVDKTVVFEGGHPSVYDPSSFSEECPRSFLVDLYKHVLLMPAHLEKCIFICLSHQLAMAALVELIKDAITELMISGDHEAIRVAAELHSVGQNMKVLRYGHVLCIGFDHVDERGWEQFATKKMEFGEGGLMRLYDFSRWVNSDGKKREDLQELIEAHDKIRVERDEIKDSIRNKAEDGFYVAMFHGDEVNVEAALFTNWALNRISSIRSRVIQCKSSAKWLEVLPSALEVLCCTVDHSTDEVSTEVAAMRIDYYGDGCTKSYHSCQFHPELDGFLRDARNLKPSVGKEDGELLLCKLLSPKQ
jgi:GMP synthase-like glutamine amidotransferase